MDNALAMLSDSALRAWLAEIIADAGVTALGSDEAAAVERELSERLGAALLRDLGEAP